VSDTADTSAIFTGQIGSTYAFYSVARDAVGHVEAPPSTADAQTVIGSSATDTPTLSATSTGTSTPTDTPTEVPTAPPTHTPMDTPTASPTTTPTACGDVDGDGRVTWRDVVAEVLALVLRRQDSRYDLNRAGQVNFEDLVIVVSQLGSTCAAHARAHRGHTHRRTGPTTRLAGFEAQAPVWVPTG
jgi:hypothetical protein